MDANKILRELYEASQSQFGRTISGNTRYALAVLRARDYLDSLDFASNYPPSSPTVRRAELRMLADMERGAK